MKSLPIKKLLEKQILNGELYSFQIVCILLALENFSGKNNCGLEIYQSWIESRKKRGIYSSSINLALLARSFELNGFIETMPVEVDPNDLMLNGGTHRTACSIFYGIDTIPIETRERDEKYRKAPKYYGIGYFENSPCFTSDQVKIMQRRWNQITNKYGLLT